MATSGTFEQENDGNIDLYSIVYDIIKGIE